MRADYEQQAKIMIFSKLISVSEHK